MNHLPPALAVLFAGVLLSACGGGGSDAPAIAASPAPVAPSPGAVPANTYPAGSQQAIAFAVLNDERQRCGFGTLSQAAPLDRSATAHASYLVTNNLVAHTEESGRPGFFGLDPLARVLAAGYPAGSVSEVIATGGTAAGSADAMRRLFGAPYHALSLLGTLPDVGLGVANYSANSLVLVGDLGAPAGRAPAPRTAVLTYPCEGTTGVIASNQGETPSPLPGIADPHWGQPLVIVGPPDLRVTAATITGPSGSVVPQVFYGDGQGADPVGSYRGGAAVLVPAVLQPNTTYRASVAWTVAGQAGSREFTFRTGLN